MSRLIKGASYPILQLRPIFWFPHNKGTRCFFSQIPNVSFYADWQWYRDEVDYNSFIEYIDIDTVYLWSSVGDNWDLNSNREVNVLFFVSNYKEDRRKWRLQTFWLDTKDLNMKSLNNLFKNIHEKQMDINDAFNLELL